MEEMKIEDIRWKEKVKMKNVIWQMKILWNKLSCESHTQRYKLRLLDSQLHLESKTELSVAKAQNYIFLEGGGTAQKKTYNGSGDTAHTLLMGRTIDWGGDTYRT